MAQPVIEISGLKKKFGRKQVLDGVDLEVPSGTVFGFLGVNGAGKTTTINIMLGLLRADAGRCVVAGVDAARDPVEVRRRVGYMAENQTMYAWMKVREIIAWCERLYPDWDDAFAESLRERMSLPADAKVGTLSRGQTSKLALVLALAHQPHLVILDDPTVGLDPIARRDFLRDVVTQLRRRDVTVFFSSHLLYEIEPICDYVAILHGGRIIACEPVASLRKRVKRVELRSTVSSELRRVPALLDVQGDGQRWLVTVADVEAARAVLEPMSRGSLATTDLSLDDIFEAYVVGRKEFPA